MMLKAQALGWGVRKLDIVSGVTFELADGEMLGLVGPNGSGKSTLLRLLSGIRRPTLGCVRIGGDPLSTMEQRAVARRIAFVEQSADTAEFVTVRDVIELGRTPWLSALSPWSERDESAVRRALAQVDMASFVDRFWHTLSGGERQRVHIARALAQEPSVLLLDEPTNHLDIHHQLAILELVRTLPVTTVVALHDLNYAFACDRVGVMHRGELVALGCPGEVLTHRLIREVFSVNVRFVSDPDSPRPILRFEPA